MLSNMHHQRKLAASFAVPPTRLMVPPPSAPSPASASMPRSPFDLSSKPPTMMLSGNVDPFSLRRHDVNYPGSRPLHDLSAATGAKNNGVSLDMSKSTMDRLRSPHDLSRSSSMIVGSPIPCTTYSSMRLHYTSVQRKIYRIIPAPVLYMYAFKCSIPLCTFLLMFSFIICSNVSPLTI